MATIIDSLSSRLPTLSATDRKIATAILQAPDAVVDMTIAALAANAGVSVASVSRFCKTIGVGGFHQLKIALARIAPPPAAVGDDLQQALGRISAAKQAEISATLAPDRDAVAKVLAALQDAAVIQVAAAGGTQPVAQDAVYKFNQLGMLAFTSTDSACAIGQTLSLPEHALLLVISNSGETRSLLQQITVAHDRGAKVVAFTNRADSPIALQADWHLQTAVRQAHFTDAYYYSRVAATAAVEAIFLLLAQQPACRAHIQAHEALIAADKI